jgi:hypothetical protein
LDLESKRFLSRPRGPFLNLNRDFFPFIATLSVGIWGRFGCSFATSIFLTRVQEHHRVVFLHLEIALHSQKQGTGDSVAGLLGHGINPNVAELQSLFLSSSFPLLPWAVLPHCEN